MFNWGCMYRCYLLMKNVLVLDVSYTKMFRNELVLASLGCALGVFLADTY